jgi:hypothetical protein
MTESDWLDCANPDKMLAFLEGKIGERKSRLFACACCRRIWRLLTSAARAGLDVAERLADGAASADEFAAACDDLAADLARSRTSRLIIGEDVEAIPYEAVLAALQGAAAPAAQNAGAAAVAAMVGGGEADCEDHPAFEAARVSLIVAATRGDSLAQTRLLRDVIGNPFRPVGCNPTWLTSTVVSLGQAAYEERLLPSGELDSARLAVLSDALEEAGCTDDAILDHLRSAGPHFRGCWALDLILGK